MARGIGYEHVQVTTDTAILATAGMYYGCMAYCHTTGPSKVLVYDAAAAAGTALVGGAYATGSAAAQWQINMVPNGIACGTGIYADVTCTSGVDSIVIFYGPV